MKRQIILTVGSQQFVTTNLKKAQAVIAALSELEIAAINYRYECGGDNQLLGKKYYLDDIEISLEINNKITIHQKLDEDQISKAAILIEGPPDEEEEQPPF